MFSQRLNITFICNYFAFDVQFNSYLYQLFDWPHHLASFQCTFPALHFAEALPPTRRRRHTHTHWATSPVRSAQITVTFTISQPLELNVPGDSVIVVAPESDRIILWECRVSASLSWGNTCAGISRRRGAGSSPTSRRLTGLRSGGTGVVCWTDKQSVINPLMMESPLWKGSALTEAMRCRFVSGSCVLECCKSLTQSIVHSGMNNDTWWGPFQGTSVDWNITVKSYVINLLWAVKAMRFICSRRILLPCPYCLLPIKLTSYLRILYHKLSAPAWNVVDEFWMTNLWHSKSQTLKQKDVNINSSSYYQRPPSHETQQALSLSSTVGEICDGTRAYIGRLQRCRCPRLIAHFATSSCIIFWVGR